MRGQCKVEGIVDLLVVFLLTIDEAGVGVEVISGVLRRSALTCYAELVHC
jgi:hypothetical protein